MKCDLHSSVSYRCMKINCSKEDVDPRLRDGRKYSMEVILLGTRSSSLETRILTANKAPGLNTAKYHQSLKLKKQSKMKRSICLNGEITLQSHFTSSQMLMVHQIIRRAHYHSCVEEQCLVLLSNPTIPCQRVRIYQSLKSIPRKTI